MMWTLPNTRILIEKLLERGKIVGLPRMLPGRQMEVRRYMPDIPMVKAAFGIEEPSTDCPLIPKEEIEACRKICEEEIGAVYRVREYIKD